MAGMRKVRWCGYPLFLTEGHYQAIKPHMEALGVTDRAADEPLVDPVIERQNEDDLARIRRYFTGTGDNDDAQ